MADQNSERSPADAADDEAAEPASSELPPEVREAIADNPEEVARLLGNLEEANDLLDIAALATSAMDDEMVTTLSESGSNLAAAADGMATPEAAQLGEAAGENASELADALESLARLQRTGTLDDVVAMADLVSLMSGALDDEMVMTLAETGTRLGELADTAADDDVVVGLDAMLQAVGEASDQPAQAPGVVGLLNSLRDPEVQRGMGFLLAIARALGRERDA